MSRIASASGNAPVPLDPLAERFAVHELHHQERVRAGAAEVDRPDDVGVVELLGRLELLLEALEQDGVLGGGRRR